MKRLPTPDAIFSIPPFVGCVGLQSFAHQCLVVVVALVRRFHKQHGGCAWQVPCRLICPRGRMREGGRMCELESESLG